MKSLRKMLVGLTAILSVLMFTSCDSNDGPEPFKAYVDVVIKDLKTDAGIKYGLVVYASSNHEIKSGKVTGPDGKVYQLTASSDKHYFSFEPQASEFNATLPTKGDYTFEIIDSENTKVTGKDVLGDEKLDAISIKSSTVTSQRLKLTWDKITGADYYTIRILNADKSLVLFSASGIIPSLTECEISTSTRGWVNGKYPVVNTNYVVELFGIKIKSGTTTSTSSNLQYLTTDSKVIKWL